MTESEQIELFLLGKCHAVVGASRDRLKYGNQVLRAFLQRGMPVFPVNPNVDEVEGVRSYPNLGSLPQAVHGVSVILQRALRNRLSRKLLVSGSNTSGYNQAQKASKPLSGPGRWD
jgi:predicted CoA-binding protein